MSARLMLPPRDRDRKRKKKVTTEEKIKPERNKSNLLGKKVPPKSRQRSARRVSSAGEKSPGFNKEKLEIEKKRKRKKEQARHLGDDTPCNFGFDLISITVWFVFSRRSPYPSLPLSHTACGKKQQGTGCCLFFFKTRVGKMKKTFCALCCLLCLNRGQQNKTRVAKLARSRRRRRSRRENFCTVFRKILF